MANSFSRACLLIALVFTTLGAAAQDTMLLTADHAQSQSERVVAHESTLPDLQQRISVDFSEAPIRQVIVEVARQADLGFSYSSDQVELEELISFSATNKSVAQVLGQIASGSSLEIVITENRDIIILEGAASGLSGQMSQSSSRVQPAVAGVPAMEVERFVPVDIQQEIRGTVYDADTGETIPGANVVVQGTTVGTTTNFDGEYQLEVSDDAEVLVFSFVGYHTEEVPIEGRTVIDVELRPDVAGLEEVIVTGAAGETRQREMGQTVARISTADLAETNLNTDELLQGRAPGVDVTSTSGSMGAGTQIRLRGNVSLSMSNQPLIIIDGVRFSADQYPRGTSEGDSFFRGSNVTQSPLNDINPNDIERIEIVRGPAASTLYGTEAAAGVIQIFTKRGQEGRPRWNVQYDQSHSFMRPFGPSNEPYLGMDPWLGTGVGHNANVSVSGGLDDIDYFVSGGYRDASGVLPNDREDRISLRGNIGFSGFDNLRLQWQTHYSSHNLENTSTGNNAHGLQFNVYRAPNNPIGSSDEDEISNILNQDIHTRNDRFNTALTARYFPLDNLDARFQVGYDRLDQRFNHVRPYGFALQNEGAISDRRWVSEGLSLDAYGRYQLGLSEELNARIAAGGQLNIEREHEIDAFGQGFPGPGNHTVTAAAERVVVANEFRVITGGFFSEGTFDYLDRYFLTLGLRVDGNSAFGDDFGFQPYPKASLSYVVSDEAFWPEQFGDFRLRAAYGQAGRAPGAFDAARTWQAEGYGGVPAFTPQNVGNPLLGPEVTNELEVGFESLFLQDRLNVEFTYYHQQTRDALFAVSQAPSLGFTGSQLENVGELTNQGVEFALQATVFEQDDYFIDLGTSLYTNRSEVLDTGGETFYNIVEGQPGPVVRGTKVLNADELADPELEFDYFFGPNQPTHIIGANLTVGLPGNVTFSARGEYQGGHYISAAASSFMVDRGAGSPSCQSAYDQVPYAADDPNNHPNMSNVPALYRVRCYRQNIESNSWIFPADFFRLRSVSLQAPIGQFVPRIDDATFTLTGRNLLTWKNDDFWEFDPEMTYRTTGDLTRFIGEHIPAPAAVTASIRIGF